MDKTELVWINSMLKEEAWMKMLVRLRASHKDSALLTYFLTQMSKAGHHSLLHGQTDNFGVFHGLLGHMLSELAAARQGREEEVRVCEERNIIWATASFDVDGGSFFAARLSPSLLSCSCCRPGGQGPARRA